MKSFLKVCGAIALCLVLGAAAEAHFGMIIPSDTMVMQNDPRTIGLEISFAHPFELVGMKMGRPDIFAVFTNGQKQDLSSSLISAMRMGAPAWNAEFGIKRPGAYLFFVEPAPYWEPAEAVYIIHYTKTVVAAFGDDEGWDSEIGLKTEIIPLSKPFGLYAGNVFQGIVKMDGKPVPFAEVEVEYYNQQRAVTAPTDFMVTQTIKADPNGVFTYAAPRAGWWGFAALSTADFKLDHEGVPKEVELGAVIWVQFHE